MRLKDKTILITGGTSGIGREMVQQLNTNNTLIVLAKDSEKIQSMRAQLPKVQFERVDLSKINEVTHVCKILNEQLSGLDLLINNAAIQCIPTFNHETFNPDTIQNEININFTAVCYLCHGLLPLLCVAKSAAILNINSGLGLVAKTSSAVYCGTKGAINLFSQSLRYQLAPVDVHVMQAFPPLVDTGMTQGRGRGKISASEAASIILKGVEQGISDNYLGKIKTLVRLNRWFPGLVRRIMKKN